MLELKGVTAGYGRVTVLRDVTIGVPSGSVVALLGPNGAGKTTLLRVASGLLRPSSGDVALDGKSLLGLPTHEYPKRGVAHIGEGRSIFRSLTVRENLTMYAPPGQEHDLIEEAVAAFPVLGERLSQTAGTLSGGQQQMLALSRLRRRDLSVVLVDEVSMGLAPVAVDQIFAFLRTIAERGTALLLVEQFVARALDLAEYVFVLNRGSVVYAGEPAEVDGSELFERYLSPTA